MTPGVLVGSIYVDGVPPGQVWCENPQTRAQCEAGGARVVVWIVPVVGVPRVCAGTSQVWQTNLTGDDTLDRYRTHVPAQQRPSPGRRAP